MNGKRYSNASHSEMNIFQEIRQATTVVISLMGFLERSHVSILEGHQGLFKVTPTAF